MATETGEREHGAYGAPTVQDGQQRGLFDEIASRTLQHTKRVRDATETIQVMADRIIGVEPPVPTPGEAPEVEDSALKVPTAERVRDRLDDLDGVLTRLDTQMARLTAL